MSPRTGEATEPPLRVTFDRCIKLELQCARITSDAGPLAYCDLDDARIVRHDRYVVVPLDEVTVLRVLFEKILRRIDRLWQRSPESNRKC